MQSQIYPCRGSTRTGPSHHHATPLAGAAGSCSRLRCRVSTPLRPVSTAPTQLQEAEPQASGVWQDGQRQPAVQPFVQEPESTYAQPSIRDTGTLRPASEWYPAWMQYRRREDNYVFWKDKFLRCSLEIPAAETRWTVFSSLWYMVVELKFFAVPPAVRYLWYLMWRQAMLKAYEAHKTLVLWQCKMDAFLAGKGSDGAVSTFSKTMALRRLHWKNSLLAELLYAVNVFKTGRIHLLPPVAKPRQRPTFFFLF